MLLKGLYTALVTPFIDGKLSLEDFKKLLMSQSEGFVDGVVVCGTTGESPVLTDEEFTILVETTVAASGRMRVFAGVGSCDTAKAVEKTKIADSLGVTGVLAVTPYYNKPTQSGLIEYYDRIADASDKQVILYSIPSRAGVEISIDTVAKLRERHSNIIGIKEATESCARVDVMSRNLGPDFAVLSGNDSMTLPFMSLGATGVVSVMSNIMPREMAAMVRLAYAGDFHGALNTYRAIAPVMDKVFIEANPLPVKFLLQKQGIISSNECRSPLGALSEKSIAELTKLPI
jgi:4-hydroxy-tetrahydrodipicolinate synthase